MGTGIFLIPYTHNADQVTVQQHSNGNPTMANLSLIDVGPYHLGEPVNVVLATNNFLNAPPVMNNWPRILDAPRFMFAFFTFHAFAVAYSELVEVPIFSGTLWRCAT